MSTNDFDSREQSPTSDEAAARPRATRERTAPVRRQSSRSRTRPKPSLIGAARTDDREDLVAWYEQLIDISRATFACGHQAVAYHALAAAVHVARELDDQQRLEDVEILAQEQMQSVDVATPSSPFSTAAAGERGMVPLWLSLARQAETARRLIQAGRAMQRLR
jgi:hypothetical protein